ncbi:GFA family protein [Vibrio sp. SCSIO 43132]|uniref:GFA family protein n=1 Tax=Vibrio sp. SCSIO 43132 TaxID=2779363 RepID=UPI001CA931C4|nr:GFA family protein [Vibrio sp. SCSIO 43132]UAB71473.1 GFA family protein [Vibrio sp. SCSIO 43132]
MIQGSCCCGAVKFVLNAKPKFLGICHCSRCRKLGTSEFFMVDKASFEWVEGKEFVEVYRAKPPFIYDRCFCSKCGSNLGEMLSDVESFPIAANTLDTDLEMKVTYQEHASSRPVWQSLHPGAKVSQ